MAGFAESIVNAFPSESVNVKGPSTKKGPFGRMRMFKSAMGIRASRTEMVIRGNDRRGRKAAGRTKLIAV